MDDTDDIPGDPAERRRGRAARAAATPAPRGNVIYGRHAVTAALDRAGPEARDVSPCRLFFLAATGEPWRRALEAEARRRGLPVEHRSRHDLDRLAGDRHHQGCVLVYGEAGEASRPEVRITDFLPVTPVDPALVLALDGIVDPRNYGACLRAAAGFGCRGVVVPERRTAPLSPLARRAAAGTERGVAIAEVTNLAAALERLREGGYWTVGLDPRAPLTIGASDLRGPRALVLGGEGQGLRHLVRARCDVLVSIPLAPGVESLNVAVAAGVALYEYRRQNTPSPEADARADRR